MYNTILGAKPLLADGSTFYYSDYNFDGKKVYKEAHWPCCSGTMPQVVADYRINTYFRDAGGVYVNLYIPSTLRWKQDGANYSLKVVTDYPLDSSLHFEVHATQSKNFALHFRIPAWTHAPTLFVNGKRANVSVAPGTFVSIQRAWRNGDKIELHLPMRTRLEPVDKRHSNTVALLYGPLVLFGMEGAKRSVTRGQLLAAKKTGSAAWQADTVSAPIVLRPFFGIADESYATYFQVSG